MVYKNDTVTIVMLRFHHVCHDSLKRIRKYTVFSGIACPSDLPEDWIIFQWRLLIADMFVRLNSLR